MFYFEFCCGIKNIGNKFITCEKEILDFNLYLTLIIRNVKNYVKILNYFSEDLRWHVYFQNI